MVRHGLCRLGVVPSSQSAALCSTISRNYFAIRRFTSIAPCGMANMDGAAEPAKAQGDCSNRSTGTAIGLAHPQLRCARSSRCPHPTGRRRKMIWKGIVRSRAIASAARRSAISGLTRKTADTVSDFTSIVHNLVMDVRDTYRPEMHYMRGPGPKWRAKHQPRLMFESEAALPAWPHRPTPVVVHRACAPAVRVTRDPTRT
jgi:hypothetical protein